jgi:hypothetical protein
VALQQVRGRVCWVGVFLPALDSLRMRCQAGVARAACQQGACRIEHACACRHPQPHAARCCLSHKHNCRCNLPQHIPPTLSLVLLPLHLPPPLHPPTHPHPTLPNPPAHSEKKLRRLEIASGSPKLAKLPLYRLLSHSESRWVSELSSAGLTADGQPKAGAGAY